MLQAQPPLMAAGKQLPEVPEIATQVKLVGHELLEPATQAWVQ